MYNDYNIPDGVGDEKKKLTVVVLGPSFSKIFFISRICVGVIIRFGLRVSLRVE